MVFRIPGLLGVGSIKAEEIFVAHATIFVAHPTIDALEFYSLGRLTEPKLAQLEEHLLVCEECQDRVSSLDRYHATLKKALQQVKSEVHSTEDGLIYNWVEVLPNGRFFGHHRGPMLDGGREFATNRQAWSYLRRSFAEMFPKHHCSKRCTLRG